jgi:aspartate kinase
MGIIVQKFGGTSVADSDKILAAARKAIRAHQEGNQVVTVVSAMGKNTDMLVDLAAQLHDNPPAREMDMLLSTGEQVTVALMAMAIHSLGYEAVSMTGAQLGIKTDSSHTKARIRSISTDRIRQALDDGKIVIAAGFQGVDDSSNITTLGRGGSDTTAVALAAALGADTCEINTDVDGVYTTDPRILPEARKVSKISYDEMLELASAGAGVMHNRAIEFAKRFDVPVHVRSSFTDTPGTMITGECESSSQPVCGAAMVKNEARVSVVGIPDKPGAAVGLFSRIAAKNIAIDMIVQNIGEEGLADISFTVFRDDLPATLSAVEESLEEIEAASFNYDDDVSVVSVVGMGMTTQTGVADRMFQVLGDAGMNIQMVTTSPIKISVLLDRKSAAEALTIVHRAFELENEPADLTVSVASEAKTSASDTDEIARMQGMEDLMIDSINLDETQARVTIHGVPDSPGLAAQLFDEISDGGVLVDLIVQSYAGQNPATLSLTVPQTDLEKTMEIVNSAAKTHGWSTPTNSPEIAVLSVRGIGMRSHTEVARRMFKALSAEGINVNMISTSEICVAITVAGGGGAKALATLEKVFADVIV